MELKEIILKSWHGLGHNLWHITAGGLAIDSINNAIQGDYKMASFEAIFSFYIEMNEYYHRQKKRIISEISNMGNMVQTYLEVREVSKRDAEDNKRSQELSDIINVTHE